MVDELAALGVHKPVLPGIMPVTNPGQVQRIAQLAGAEFPPGLAERFAAVADDPAAVRERSASSSPPSCAPSCSTPGRRACTSTR